MSLYPITISIPAEKIVGSIPKKTRIMSALIPGNTSTYIYNDEESYYQGYKESMFAITKKKGGWDCLRHYEIIACGTIPYFEELDQCPIHTLSLFPKEYVLQGNLLYSKIKEYSFEEIPEALNKEYYALVEKLVKHLRAFLTTEKMVDYILEKTNKQNVKKVLYLSQFQFPDYIRCLTLHGFKKRFGQQCIDFPKIMHLYKDQGINYHLLYGKGMTYSSLLTGEYRDDPVIQQDSVMDAITNHEYDLIIYGSYHRGMLYYEHVCNHYKPNEVVLLCGEDCHNCGFEQHVHKGHHIFVREL